jgi:uncharacterized protein
VSVFGPDFSAVQRQWLYRGVNAQPLWLALVLFVFLLLAHVVLQGVAGIVVGGLLGEASDPRAIVKGTIIGMLPVALVVSAACYYAVRIKGGNSRAATALHFPKLGAGGWLTLTMGFLVVMYGFIIVVVAVTGIDINAYTPGPDGQSPDTGSAGLVKEAMFDLANEPLLLALAFPSVALGAPIVEEFLFRGPVFAALAQTRLGRMGTVLVTSASWALMHGTEPWFSIGLIFVMGIVLGLLLLRFGSLWVTMICHGVWNGIFTLAVWGAVGQGVT